MAVIPCKIAAKAVEVKLGQELTENESLAPLHVICDKCKTDFASESAFLKLHKTMYHKYDEVNRKADEAVEEKLKQTLAKNESLAPLHVTRGKCKTDFAFESALKLHKTRNDKYDEVSRKADEAVKEKLKQTLAENERFAPLHVKCDKCNTDFDSESTLKHHEKMYHNCDEINRKKLAENECLLHLPKLKALSFLNLKQK